MTKRQSQSNMASKSKSSRDWQFEIARRRFGEVCRLALSEGPQYVIRDGKEVVVVVAAQEFERLKPKRQPKTLAEFFAQSPLVGSGIDLERKPDYPRKIKL